MSIHKMYFADIDFIQSNWISYCFWHYPKNTWTKLWFSLRWPLFHNKTVCLAKSPAHSHTNIHFYFAYKCESTHCLIYRSNISRQYRPNCHGPRGFIFEMPNTMMNYLIWSIPRRKKKENLLITSFLPRLASSLFVRFDWDLFFFLVILHFLRNMVKNSFSDCVIYNKITNYIS